METCDIERCIVYYLKKMLTTPHLDNYSTTDPKPDRQVFKSILIIIEIILKNIEFIPKFDIILIFRYYS